MTAEGVRASGGIADLLSDGGSGFKGEISDAGCDHPFSPLLPALTLLCFLHALHFGLLLSYILYHCFAAWSALERVILAKTL